MKNIRLAMKLKERQTRKKKANKSPKVGNATQSQDEKISIAKMRKFTIEHDSKYDTYKDSSEFKELTKDAFMEAYSLGYSMNNEGSIKTKIKDIPVEDISRQAKRFMENRSLLIADRELNKYKQTIKEVIDRGMSTSPRLSAQNIKNELKGILPVERMENP